jgi:hypothetical protein
VEGVVCMGGIMAQPLGHPRGYPAGMKIKIKIKMRIRREACFAGDGRSEMGYGGGFAS